MRRNWVLCAILAAGSALSCGSPEEPVETPNSETWKLGFQNERSAEYGGSDCVKTFDLYCRTWVDDASGFSGTLRRTGNAWLLVVPDGSYSATQSHTSGDSVLVILKKDEYCSGYNLKLPAISDSIAGRFTYQRDCHGPMRLGSFRGRH